MAKWATNRATAREENLSIDCVGPPGASYAETDRLMNSARVGPVCGIDDGAPAILIEYMLAGLPVLANAGLRYITPETGLAAGPGVATRPGNQGQALSSQNVSKRTQS